MAAFASLSEEERTLMPLTDGSFDPRTSLGSARFPKFHFIL